MQRVHTARHACQESCNPEHALLQYFTGGKQKQDKAMLKNMMNNDEHVSIFKQRPHWVKEPGVMKDSQHASQRDRVHQSPMQPFSSWHQRSTTDFTATRSRFTLPGTKGWEAILDQHQRQPSADVTAGVSGSNFCQSESCSHFTDLI